MDCEGFHMLLWIWAGVALAVFALLLFISAPYGRHNRKGWGPSLRARTGWILMELPSPLVFTLFFLSGPGQPAPVAWIFFALYVGHYANRSLVYPFRSHAPAREMPVAVVLMAVFFNLLNGFSNGYFFSSCAMEYGMGWLTDPRFISGMLLFLSGAAINIWSDEILMNLRRRKGKGYFLPESGMFRWISCPNYFGEVIEWAGFALLTWSPAAGVFALWTTCNLVPRALDHHRWYQDNFPDYPPDRKAILPGIL